MPHSRDPYLITTGDFSENSDASGTGLTRPDMELTPAHNERVRAVARANPSASTGRLKVIQEVDRRLSRRYGEPRKPSKDAVSQLVGTILSQATTDVQTARSFAELRRRFPTWEQVRDAPVSQIARAIRSSGLSKQKAPRIKKALQHITKERGRIELNFLRKLPPDAARHWLLRIAGVGPKTASIVLLFSFQHPLFPVDTHIHRVTKRLGWIPQNASAEKAHELLRVAVPPGLHYRLHLNLIRLGREVCQARRPRCEVCPLTEECEYYETVHG